MFTKLSNRIESEKGFTLIELLVVILIIGILAAIAVPSFLNQREKGQDACAKSMIRTTQTAMETYYTDTNSYATATVTLLNGIEQQIPTGAACGGTATANSLNLGAAGTTNCTTAAPGTNNYCIGLTSTSGRAFSLHRTAAGTIIRSCGAAITGITGNTAGGGCSSTSTW